MERKLKRIKKGSPSSAPKAHRRSFDGKIGEEYMLFRKAIPHFEVFQEAIGGALMCASPYLYAKPSFSIVELGCGPGTTTSKLLLFNPNASLVKAIDNSEVMFKQARGRLGPFVTEGIVELIHADATDYLRKVPTKSLDSIASGWMIHNFTQNARAILHAEIYRVLKKEVFL